MLKEQNTIKVKLTNYGSLETICLPVKLYKDSFNVVKLACLVPKYVDSNKSLVKVYGSALDISGKQVWTTQTYNLVYAKDVVIDNCIYEKYESPLPEEFCANSGDITLTFAQVVVDEEDNITKLLTSGSLNLFVDGEGYDINGVKISNYDVTAAEVNLLKQTMKNTVMYVPQLLSEEQKGQARSNIGAGANGFSGSWFDLTQRPQETIDFAESERQKSKNLFKVNNVAGYSITRNGVTATINDDYTITLNGTCTGNVYFNMFNGIETGSNFLNTYPKLYLDSNKTYTYLLKVLSGSYSGTGTDSQIVGASFRQTDGTGVVVGKFADLSIKDNNEISSVTKTGIDYLNNGYFRATSGLTYTNYTFGLMICEGEDTDFQSWNGETLHKNDITDVEHIETIYDMSSSDSNINWGYTSGIKGGVTISDKDFSKYKELEVYACMNASLVKFTIDLTQSIIGLNTDFNYYYISGAKVSPIDSYYSSMSIICYVNPEKTSFCHHMIGFDNNSATFNERNDRNEYIVYKIKGVY